MVSQYGVGFEDDSISEQSYHFHEEIQRGTEVIANEIAGIKTMGGFHDTTDTPEDRLNGGDSDIDQYEEETFEDLSMSYAANTSLPNTNIPKQPLSTGISTSLPNDYATNEKGKSYMPVKEKVVVIRRSSNESCTSSEDSYDFTTHSKDPISENGEVLTSSNELYIPKFSNRNDSKPRSLSIIDKSLIPSMRITPEPWEAENQIQAQNESDAEAIQTTESISPLEGRHLSSHDSASGADPDITDGRIYEVDSLSEKPVHAISNEPPVPVSVMDDYCDAEESEQMYREFKDTDVNVVSGSNNNIGLDSPTIASVEETKNPDVVASTHSSNDVEDEAPYEDFEEDLPAVATRNEETRNPDIGSAIGSNDNITGTADGKTLYDALHAVETSQGNQETGIGYGGPTRSACSETGCLPLPTSIAPGDLPHDNQDMEVSYKEDFEEDFEDDFEPLTQSEEDENEAKNEVIEKSSPEQNRALEVNSSQTTVTTTETSTSPNAGIIQKPKTAEELSALKFSKRFLEKKKQITSSSKKNPPIRQSSADNVKVNVSASRRRKPSVPRFKRKTSEPNAQPDDKVIVEEEVKRKLLEDITAAKVVYFLFALISSTKNYVYSGKIS